MFPLGSVSPVVFQNQFRLTSGHSSLSHSQTHTPASTLYSHKGGVVRHGRFGSRTMIGAALSASGLFHCDFPVDGQW
jgi:hypothetical protein